MQKRIVHNLLWAVILLFSLLALDPGISISAAENAAVFRIEKEPEVIRRGSSFSIVLSPAQSAISAFVLFAEYDPTDIAQAKAVFSDELTDAYLYTSEQEGRLAIVYTSKNGNSMSENGTLTLTFRTNTETFSDSAPVHITVTDAAAADASALIHAPESYDFEAVFMPEPSSGSALLSLTPPTGTLVPAFDPEIFDYTLDVPFSNVSLVFDAVPVEGATVRVNRKNLGAGGSTVDFSFTVTAEDGVTKSVYTVAVTRLAKESTSSTSSGTTGSSSRSSTSSESAGSADTDLGTDTDDDSSVLVPASAVDTVYVSSNGTTYDARADRFETMVLVLISVGAGMGFVVFVQRFGKERDPDDRDK